MMNVQLADFGKPGFFTHIPQDRFGKTNCSKPLPALPHRGCHAKMQADNLIINVFAEASWLICIVSRCAMPCS
jgi:hypothetical protein